MSPFTRKRARKVLSAALFTGILLASSGALLVLEAQSAAASGPVPVTIQAPATGTYVYTTDPTFSGIATPGETITLTTSQGPGCTAVADSTDAWSCDANGISTAQRVTATATGNLTDSPPNRASSTFAAVIWPVINGTTFQQIRSTNASPTLTGTADPGAAVTVLLNSSSCSTTADPSGNWTCTIAPPLPDAAGYGDPEFGMLADQTPTWSGGRTSVYIADTYVLILPLPDPAFSSPVNTSTGAGTAHLIGTSPVLTGTAEPHANVNVTYGLLGSPSSGAYCSAVADATGAFSCPFSGGTPMTVGNTYYVRAEQIDGVHPSNSGATNLFYLAFINPPSVPVITSPAPAYQSSNAKVAVAGTGDDGDTVTATIDGTAACAGVVSAGVWTCTTAALAPGPHQLAATAGDAYGNKSASSPSRSLTILGAPPAPTITSPANGYTNSHSEVVVTGTGVTGEAIRLTFDGGLSCIQTITAGKWSCDLGAVDVGPHTLTAVEMDSYGTTSASTPTDAFTIVASPNTPVITGPANLYESSQTSVTVDGTSDAGDTVQVTVDGGTRCSSAAPTGTWTCQLTGLGAGAHSLVAQAVDGYGSTSAASNPVGITIAAPPAVPTITTPASGYQSSKPIVTVGGAGDDGDTVYATIDGALACSAVVTGGAWSCATAALGVGSHTLAAYAIDQYGDQSASSATQNLIILGAPGTPTISSPASGFTTSHADVVVSGTGVTGNTLHLTLDTAVGCTQLISAGQWSCDLGNVAVGPHTLSAFSTDAFGTSSAATPTQPFTIVAAPNAPVITSPANLYSSSNPAVTVAGSSDAGSTVRVTVDGVTGCSSPSSAGAWSCQLTGLTPGAHSIVAFATDQYSSVSPGSVPVSITIASPPSVPTITAPAAGFETSKSIVTVTGKGDSGDTVHAIIDGAAACSAVVAGGTWSCVTPALATGAHTLAASALDPFGTQSAASAAQALTIVGAPAVPVITSPANGYSNSHPEVVVTGTGATGSTVQLIVDGAAVCAQVVTAGAWSCDLGAVAVGPHTLSASQTDVYGTSSAASATRAFTIVAAPHAPVITAPANHYTSSNTTVTVAGTSDAGATIQVSVDGETGCSATAGTAEGSGGAWSCQLTGLSTAAHSIVAQATDQYGSISPDSTAIDITIVAPPAAPTVTTPANGYQSSQPAVTVSGAGVTGLTVQSTLDGALGCSAVVVGGAWSCTDLGLAVGPHVIAAYSIDAYGSNSTPSASNDITIVDPPIPPPVTGPTNLYQSSQTTLSVSGSSPTGLTVVVSVDGATGCTALVGDGEWTCELTGLSVGSHSLTVVATDAYGSKSSGDGGTVTFVILPPPGAPIITTPSDGLKTTATAIVVGGTGAPQTTVRVELDGKTGCTTPTSDLGTWSCAISGLSVNTHSIDAVATDQYGTSSPPSATETITIARAAGALAAPTPTATPGPTATPTATPTPSPTTSPSGDGKLAITGNTHSHGRPTPPAQGIDAPTTFSTLHAIPTTRITPLGAAVTGGVAAGFILLVAFPSELLKNTIRENYEMAFQWLAPTRRWFGVFSKRAKAVRINPWIGGTGIILLAAVFLGLAEPDFGFNGSSARLWFALVLSLAAVNLIVPAVTGIVSRRAFSASITVRPLPAALLFVLASALISRVAHIEPGFLFAGVLGITFGAQLNRRKSGTLALVAVGVTVALGIAAWIGYSAAAPIAEAHPTFWNLLWSEALSATTVEALATLVISMLPLRFLDGAIIFAWKKWVWAVVYFAAVLILIFVIAPISDNWGEETAPLLGWGVFFIVFALVAVGIWALFRLRAHEEKLAEEE